jgi:hypothetical protein
MVSRFESGQIVCTRNALNVCEAKGINPLALTGRHLAGDWGDLEAGDKKMNDDAMASGEDRILSAYQVSDVRFYVITEWDRSVTTLLLASDY